MPDKIDSYRSYGQKLISLFAKLLFSGQSYSLGELAHAFSCSKQTILRLVDDIRMSYGVTVEEAMNGNRKYFQIKRPGGRVAPPVDMTEAEMSTLFICQAFAEHLLGRGLIEDSTRALEKSQALLAENKAVSPDHFASFKPGSIDYMPHHASIRALIEAMENQRVCKITYKSTMAESAKTFYIKPLKIFSYRDTVYLHTRSPENHRKHIESLITIPCWRYTEYRR
jgi:predicted DNA-binding transcriptional regulator YafY